MAEHRAVLVTLSILAAISVLMECRPHQHNGHRPHQQDHSSEANNHDCVKCKPGYYVRHKCNIRTDTICAPCGVGTYTSQYNWSEKCSKCSQCREGSFILKECTKTYDTVCDLCATEYPPDTQEFTAKCSQYLSYMMPDESKDFQINDAPYLPSDGSGDPDTTVLHEELRHAGHAPLPESEEEDEGDEDDEDASSSGSGSNGLLIDPTDSNVSAIAIPDVTGSPSTTTEAGEDDGSGLGEDVVYVDFGGMFSKPENVTTSTDAAPKIVTLPPDLGAEEGLIPVTVTKFSPTTQNLSTSPIMSPKASTIPSTQETKPPPLRLIPPPIGEVEVKLGGNEDDTVDLSEDDETSDLETPSPEPDHHLHHPHRNVSGKDGGKRRRPVHTEIDEETLDDDMSVGAIKEGENEKEEKKGVSYFAVIAAALISAIVFFTLGFVASKLKNLRRGNVDLPQPEVALQLKSGAEKNSPSKEYGAPDPAQGTSVYDEIDHGQMQSRSAPNGHMEQSQPKANPFRAEADIEKNPDTDTYAVPMKDLSAKPPSTSGQGGKTAPSGPRMSQIKFMDETDDELETNGPEQSTPLLPPSENTEAETERGDFASQVLSTVDKNLHADSEKESLLNGGSSEVTSEVHT